MNKKRSKMFVWSNFFPAITLSLFILLVHAKGDSRTIFKEKGFQQKQTSKMINQTRKKAVSPGDWGGEGIGLTVEDEGGKIQFDCAEAEITEKIMIDKKGNFRAKGNYLRRTPGPIRLKLLPKPQPAKFVGKITGKKMTLKIILTENDEEVGIFQLERGKTAKIRRCL